MPSRRSIALFNQRSATINFHGVLQIAIRHDFGRFSLNNPLNLRPRLEYFLRVPSPGYMLVVLLVSELGQVLTLFYDLIIDCLDPLVDELARVAHVGFRANARCRSWAMLRE